MMGLKKDIPIGILVVVLLFTSVMNTCTIEYYCDNNGLYLFIYREKVTLLEYYIKSDRFFEEGKILNGKCSTNGIKIE